MRITCKLDVRSETGVAFEPRDVVDRLRTAFPEADVDPTDHSAAEVEQARAVVESQSELPAARRETMLRQIEDKARREGPVYRFTLAGISGFINRFRIIFKSDAPIANPLEQRIVAFLESLGRGTVDVMIEEPDPTDPDSAPPPCSS